MTIAMNVTEEFTKWENNNAYWVYPICIIISILVAYFYFKLESKEDIRRLEERGKQS